MGFGKNLRLARMIRAKKKEIMFYAGGTAKKIFDDQAAKALSWRKELLARLKKGDFGSESVELAEKVHRFYKENSRPAVSRLLGLPGLRLPVDLERSQALVRHVREGRCEEPDFDFLEREFPGFVRLLGEKIESGLKKLAEKTGGEAE